MNFDYIFLAGLALGASAFIAAPATAATIIDNNAALVGTNGTTFGNGFGDADSQVVTGPGFAIDVNGKRFDGIGPIDIVFSTEDSGDGVAPSTTYNVAEEITNNTAVAFTSFIVQLGFGTGSGFVSSLPSDGLNFVSLLSTSSAFAANVTSFDSITYFGGTVNPGETFTLNFAVLVPDGLSTSFFAGSVNPDAPDFTLRQFPVAVPEPFAVAGVGGLGLIALRRRLTA